jgi:hypothetical protein
MHSYWRYDQLVISLFGKNNADCFFRQRGRFPPGGISHISVLENYSGVDIPEHVFAVEAIDLRRQLQFDLPT